MDRNDQLDDFDGRIPVKQIIRSALKFGVRRHVHCRWVVEANRVLDRMHPGTTQASSTAARREKDEGTALRRVTVPPLTVASAVLTCLAYASGYQFLKGMLSG